jgi:polyketide synthase PksN
MIYQEQLRDLTEAYLKSLVAEASDSLTENFDSSAPFGELGINSFYVLKIIKKLEVDFGTLSKSLLFEKFTVDDLAEYFVAQHEPVLSRKFARQLDEAHPGAYTNGRPLDPAAGSEAVEPRPARRADATAGQAAPIRILEKEAYTHPEFAELIQRIFNQYKIEGSVSRGTRRIAPNLFIGSARLGYFNYGRSKNIVLVYAYTGPEDYFPALMAEMYRYCEANGFELNTLADAEIPAIGGVSFSATPFGALQRISHLEDFTLEGGDMRRLRHQVSKFQKSGECRTQEYQCGSSPETDKSIAAIIDKWCETKSMVNPLVYDAKREILAGKLSPEHRLFLTYLDQVLQNVILITAMAPEVNGYLMDLEFYLPDMPRGGLEFAIVQIIEVLAAEGCDVLSLGGTYGCKLTSSSNADAGIDKILEDLRGQNIFNDEGNLQFKNKFRPENKSIYLCRPVGSGNPDNVIDIIMMIADPDRMQASNGESDTLLHSPMKASAPAVAAPAPNQPAGLPLTQPGSGGWGSETEERSHILSKFGFNPLNIPHEYVELDLKTDSWAQLAMPSIEAQMRHLHGQLQQPVNVDEVVRGVFPFAYSVLTSSGQAAESIFFKAWPKKGIVPQNLLFPSTIFHQIDKGFTVKELPHPAVLQLDSQEPYKGNMNWEALQKQVALDPAAIAFVLLEVGNNAAGGYPVSLQHLRNVKALLAEYSIPLVLDGTRVVENAQFLMEQEKECSGKTLWTIVREIFAHADAVIGSLTKDFCVNKGGIVATDDLRLFERLQELVYEEGAGIDLIDKKMIALSLQNQKQIEAQVLRRMEGVGRIWRALDDHKVPILKPAGGHCVVIDVKQIAEFQDFAFPVASFLAWLYLNTGIRAAAHSVGMEKRTLLSDLVRLAVPVGLKEGHIVTLIERLTRAFDEKANIPEIVMENSKARQLGSIHANYKLIGYHRQAPIAGCDKIEAGQAPASPPSAISPRPETVVAAKATQEKKPEETIVSRKPHQGLDIAIVGMAGRYPKARDLGELWQNLAQGKDCIEEIHPDRYERRLQHGSAEKYRGGFIDDVDKFDSLFFNISPREAEMLDPQERLFLEVAWEAVEDAGYYPETLVQNDPSRSVGVFVGAVWAMYQMLGLEEKHAGNKVVPNSFLWSIANRVSYWMNFSGPSMTVDTACSSSLTAVSLACEAIRTGECSAAIVGGVNLDVHQTKLDINQAGGALSSDGVCRSFGKNANGYVAGEGVGALLLKPLDRAVQDGDHVYGVIKSAVLNHGGRTSGYTVPNPKAQTNLIASALEKAGIEAGTIGYIEAHGTGTELGDPLEIAGLTQAFSADHVENQTCAIGSIKSNIGHLEAAAGVVSLSKVLLQMQHRQLVPSLHSAELNGFIDFQTSPFYVVQRLQEWKAKEVDGAQLPLRAGVSSFGAGGSNAHIILEDCEAIGNKVTPAPATDMIFPLSARSEDQLRETAARLGRFLQQSDKDLEDVAYTLQIGRKSFEHRLAIVARTKEELGEKLDCFVAGRKAEDVSSGHVKSAEAITRLLNRREREEFIRLLSQGRDPRRIASLWAEGLLADWQGFQSHGRGKRISLPTYPFADKRHWASQNSSISHWAAVIHPLVDTNESTFERQIFKKTFNSQDFFIYDHLVANVPTLPGVAYLELARKAGEIAAGRKVQKIRNILWVSPIAVQNSIPKEVFIELKPSQAAVKFEVFSNDAKGNKLLHSQGSLLYATQQEAAAEPEYIDLESVRARCAKVIDGKSAYPLFKQFGLNLGPSFQVLQDVYKNESETLGVLKLPEFRQAELESMVLHPSLVDGSLQAGMGAQLGETVGEMFVPFSIGEVEILHPLQSNCFSYVTEVKEDKKGKRESARVLKSNVYILDEAGKILVKIRESIGVPLRELHDKPVQTADAEGFSRLYYAYEWEKAPLAAETQTNPGSLVLFDTGETLRDLYQGRLRKAGMPSDQIILVRPGESFQDLGKQSYQVNPQKKEDFTRLFEVLLQTQYPVENICFAWPRTHTDLHDEKCVRESLELGIYSFLFVCQALIKQKLESKVQLLYLYCGTQDEPQPHNDAMRGFVNSLHLEHPKLLSKTLEVRQEGAGYEQILDAVSIELQARTQDATAVRYQAQDRFIKKLKACDLGQGVGSAAPEGMSLRQNGSYLITGGVGGLGLIFAQYLAKEFKARLVLTGRSRLSVEQEAKLEELRSLGAEVLYLQADVSKLEEVTMLVKQSKARFGEIHGIIHAAGVLRDSLVRNKTAEEMTAVFAPKVYGTLHLDEVTKDEQLDFFVAFSSLAAVAGNAGQCDYCFANHFMDSVAAERELLRAKGARSGKTLSINWSLWAEGGMKLDEQTELYFKKTLGIKPLSTRTGLEAFVDGLASKRTQFAVLEGVQDKVEIAWGLRKKKVAPPSFVQAVAEPVAEQGGGDHLARLQSELSQMVVEFLKLAAGEMSADKILLDLGFDSIGLTTFANAINDKYQVDITPVLFFDYPSVGEIAKYLSEERQSEIRQFYGGGAKVASIATPLPETKRQTETQPGARPGKGWDPTALNGEAMSLSSGHDYSPERRFINTPIAIVGMSGVMPQSQDLEEFWENLKNSKDMTTVIPTDRWRWEDYYGDPLKEANKSNSKWGGFMKEIDKFDPLFFSISPREAQVMDPQQRIFLEQVWKAIEDSGHKVSDLSGTRTGLFVGVATNDYIDVMNSAHSVLDGYTASGNSHSVLANRVSFLLNLRGPSAPIDTACSSSLVALHRAIESIHTGSSDMAIVGGVQVMMSPAAYISFAMAGMLSSDGQCKTFDKRANGYVRGEGAGAIFLKRLADAEADGDHIYAVIKATAENHGGRVTTLTAPNSGAQSSLLIEAYEKAHIDPTTVGYIECHGTGTSLGDPIEIQGLSKAFSELYKRHNRAPASIPHCGLSSVKTNIGHLETAAGIASMLKVLLAIKHRQIPANIHFEEINPYINLKGTPFYIADKLTAWEAARGEDGAALPLRAGVSSFGFGGANAHIVLEEYVPAKHPALELDPQLIVLSAKNEDRLQAYVQSMHSYLEKHGVALRDLAYTLQGGRDEMAERLALVVSSTDELRQKLGQILAGGESPGQSYRNNIGNSDGKSPVVDVLIEQRDLSRLAELWVSGAKIDWRLLYGADVPQRISVPTYPFARERYWIPNTTAKSTEARHDQGLNSTAALHPLVHRNVSTLEEQKFSSCFTGEEFYFTDHVVDGQKILPGVAYLEMAKAAGELSGNSHVGMIRSVTWERPLIVGSQAEEVELSLTPVKNEIKFSVKSAGKENPILYCTGKIAYSSDALTPEMLDIAAIQERCSEQVMSGEDLYPLLSGSGLKLGKSFQIVERIFANASESLAILKLPEHLKEESSQFWLHPALMDGSLHTAIGLMKKNELDIPLSIPYSAGEVQIFHSLKDLHYGYATWALANPLDNQNHLRVHFHLLDKSGRVLVRIKDFVSRPVRRSAVQPQAAIVEKEFKAGLQSLVPVWKPVHLETGKENAVVAASIRVLLLGGDEAGLDWVLTCYPNSQHLGSEWFSSVALLAGKLGDGEFDQLLWIAPESSSAGIIAEQEEGVLAVFRIIKALLQLGYGNKKLQWTVVTIRTQGVVESDPIQAAHAGIAGLLGSLAKEYPRWDLRLLDLDSLGSVSAQACLSLPWDKQGNALAHRRQQWFEQALEPMAAQPAGTPVYRQNGVYVVVGGGGGIGEVWTRFMMQHYQANVVWIGRRKYDAAMEKKIDSLTSLGRTPVYISADATDLSALQQACETVLKIYPAIHGVVHSAIVLHDQSLAGMDESGFRAGFSAKVDISVNMDRVFGRQELDFMLFFSSIVSFFKSPGQSNYSAGCTFKDSFAHQLQQQRAYPVKVMNWGYWGSVGVAADEFHRKIMERMGIGSIEPQEGMESLQALLSSQVPQMVLIKTLQSETAAAQQHATRKIEPFIAAKGIELKVGYAANGHPPLGELTPPLRNAHIQKTITDKLGEALKLDAAMIRRDVPFADYGVDSITGVSFVNTINETLKIELQAAKLFEYSTVDQLTEYIQSNWPETLMAQTSQVQDARRELDIKTPMEVAASSTHRFLASDLPATAYGPSPGSPEGNGRSTSIDPIAIVGMSGRFAGSESLDEFWLNLKDGKDLVTRVSRWSPADCVMSQFAGGSYCDRGSFIDSVDRFDPSFFSISRLEAIYMDPQQRLFLEECWKALEDAGYAGSTVHEKQCGVYVGCGSSNYDRLFPEGPPPQAWWGNSQSVAPARIAYYLNLQGPAIAIDTACSSSLVAIHLACQGLWSRETEMAIAGGVYVEATPGFHQVANRGGMLSPDGKCYSFDSRANGFVPGEGVAVLVLKRLQDALQDGDHIHGVIAGSGINQNGKSNGLIAPNARAQERLERSVYERFHINPETIQVVEAHGTGTIVGDSIEYGAISRAFREYTDKRQFCAIGSVKTNIGHGATAAGVSGVIKLLLSLKHRQIPPSLHFQTGNPAIDFDSGPFFVNTQLEEWKVEDNQRRRAAVSSFGFSGTNAHMVIEEAPAIEPTALESPAYMVVLSARSPEQLKQQVRNLLAQVRLTPALSMNDLSFTLIAGRMHLTHRLSCLARNQGELIGFLEQWLETGAASRIYTAKVQEGQVREQVSLKKFGNYCIEQCTRTTQAAEYMEHLATIADLYIQGYSLDFEALFAPASRRMPLPAYPFARERYWIDMVSSAEPASSPAKTALDNNTSDPVPERDSSTFIGAEEDILLLLQRDLTQIAVELLQGEPGDVSPDKVLLDLGFDSSSLTSFANAINQKYQLDITPVLFFDYYSIAEIATHLSMERKKEIIQFYRSAATSPAPPSGPPAKNRAPAESYQPAALKTITSVSASSGKDYSAEDRFINTPIAIVGMSGVMPQSEDLEEFWENLKNSKDMTTVIPPDRWRWEDFYGDPLKEANKSNSKWGGFMKEIDKFDPLFFSITPREARMMDPQQRIFLEHVWRAIEDSGHKVSDLSGTRTGLFVGVASNEYIDILSSLDTVLDAYTVSGNSHSVLANRVSFLLNLRGPSAPIDTACSSSLVALHRAIESIHTGSSDMAIVGGVQVMMSPAAGEWLCAGRRRGRDFPKTLNRR